jgi:hypothetical protein
VACSPVPVSTPALASNACAQGPMSPHSEGARTKTDDDILNRSATPGRAANNFPPVACRFASFSRVASSTGPAYPTGDSNGEPTAVPACSWWP